MLSDFSQNRLRLAVKLTGAAIARQPLPLGEPLTRKTKT
jgi:hypothetical protein